MTWRTFEVSAVLGYGKKGAKHTSIQRFPRGPFDAAKQFVEELYPDYDRLMPARDWPLEKRGDDIFKVWSCETYNHERCISVWIKEQVK